MCGYIGLLTYLCFAEFETSEIVHSSSAGVQQNKLP